MTDPTRRGAFHYARPELDTSWLTDAACRGADPNLFHPEIGDQPRSVDSATYQAKKVCRTCPVIEQCLDYALHLPATEVYGIWGGTSEVERKRLRREMRARGELPASSHRPAPIRHGEAKSYYRCKKINGTACEACRDARAIEKSFSRESRAAS